MRRYNSEKKMNHFNTSGIDINYYHPINNPVNLGKSFIYSGINP